MLCFAQLNSSNSQEENKQYYLDSWDLGEHIQLSPQVESQNS